MVNKWSKIVQNFFLSCPLLPIRCVLCMQHTQREISLCAHCEAMLPWLGKATCQYCALPCNPLKQTCFVCERQRPPFAHLQALFDYTYPLDRFILRFKYQGQLHFAKLLGHLMATHLICYADYDCIIPVPLHRTRQRERGFNQTLELAKVISKIIKVPINRSACKRIRENKTQSLLSSRHRRRNITPQSFQIGKELLGKKLLVIEDVVTTRSTIDAFSAALVAKGVKFFDIWACCRTLKNKA